MCSQRAFRALRPSVKRVAMSRFRPRKCIKPIISGK